jgi:uncharacterized protein (TIGR02246 family)
MLCGSWGGCGKNRGKKLVARPGVGYVTALATLRALGGRGTLFSCSMERSTMLPSVRNCALFCSFMALAMGIPRFSQADDADATRPASGTPETAAADVDVPVVDVPGLDTEAQTFFAGYLNAFNAADTEALATMWAADAVWTSDIDGSSTEGREAIIADLKESLTLAPGLRLSAQLERVREIAQGVVSVDGQVISARPDEPPTQTSFTAILVNRDNSWQISTVHEFATPVPATPYERLKQFEFLIGEWYDESPDANITTTFRWGAGQSFLIRSYIAQVEGAEPLQGTQVFGWDPREQVMRSWSFDSLGGFGQGTWSKSGDEWVGRLGEVLPDGGTAAATQVIRRIDNDTLEVTTVGREVNGEPQPSSDPVRVVRAATVADEVTDDTAE